MFKFPENTTRFTWTRHIKNKMVFYNVSSAQILRIFSTPQRREEAIAPGTIGAMRVIKHNVNKTAPGQRQKPRETELWIMYKMNAGTKGKPAKSKLEELGYKRPKTTKIMMISVWRYPGRTKPGERPNIPEGIIEELAEEGVI